MNQPVGVRIFSEDFYTKADADYVLLAQDGAIEKSSTTLWDQAGRFFSFTQDPNLIAVNQKLSTLMREIQAGQGNLYDRLKAEVHHHGISGFLCLQTNLIALNSAFKSSNSRSPLSVLILKVINFFCSLIGHPPINLKTHEIFPNLLQLRTQLSAAFHLTEADRKKAQYALTIGPEGNNGAVSRREALSQDNISKLECGLIHEIMIHSSGHEFSLSYDEVHGFKLSHWSPVWEPKYGINVYKYSGIPDNPPTTHALSENGDCFVLINPGYMYQLGDDAQTAVTFKLTKN